MLQLSQEEPEQICEIWRQRHVDAPAELGAWMSRTDFKELQKRSSMQYVQSLLCHTALAANFVVLA